MHAFQLDWVKNATVLKLKNYRPRVSKKTKTNSPQLDQGIALQQGTPHKELRKKLPIQNQSSRPHRFRLHLNVQTVNRYNTFLDMHVV